MHRRTFIKASLALTAFGLPAVPVFARADDKPAPARFDFAWLKQRAKRMAGQPYRADQRQLPESLTGLSPQAYHDIRYKRARALWAGDADTDLRVHFYHVGMHFDRPVTMHRVDPGSGRARVLHFDPAVFDYAGSGVDPTSLAGADLGFAGFKLANNGEATPVREVASFLGASYFRAIDNKQQYGSSARGLAVDTALPRPEEFPDFTDFWFVHPGDKSQQVTVYALLDSPSVTGAYRFDIDCGQPEGVVMTIAMDIYARKTIERLGVAPMTSMFLKGSSQAQARDTIHPQIHDADRLKMWRGNGEWITRPLFNPRTLQYNAFADHNPKGFGLIQYDHDFDDYRDDVAWYNRRPSLWVEPSGDWGAGTVTLVELPTLGETVDNIAAFWQPRQPVKRGDHRSFGYKLYWWPRPPVAPTLAHVDKTWSGMGNVPEGWIPGGESPSRYARRFAIDFVGGPLPDLADDAQVTAEVEVSRGQLGKVETRRFKPLNGYRAIFDWEPQSDADGAVTMRVYLRAGERTLTETWLYQWVPPKAGQRHYDNEPKP